MRTLRKLATCLLLILVALSGLTVYGREDAFTEQTFANGVTFVYRQLPAAKSVSARIVVPVGFLHEPQDYLEISHLVEHLVFRGNDKGALSGSPDLMDKEGNHYNAFTTLNRTEYILESTADNLLPAFSLFLDLILEPAFAPADVEKEKKIVTVEKALRDTPGNLFLTYLNHLTQNQLTSKIQAIDRQHVLAFHRQHYTVDQLTVIITGNFDAAEIAAHLAALPKPETAAAPKPPLGPPAPIEADLVLEDYLPGTEYRLLFGFNLGAIEGKDQAIAKILPSILLFESRQYDYVTNRPLDYDCYLFKLGADFYLIFGYNDVREEYTPEMKKWHERNINRYYKYLKAKDFSKFLKAVSTSLQKELKLMEASPGILSEYYSQLRFEPTTITADELKIIKALSAKDLKYFVEKYLEGQSYHQLVIKAIKREECD